jgi:hypothetical protein
MCELSLDQPRPVVLLEGRTSSRSGSLWLTSPRISNDHLFIVRLCVQCSNRSDDLRHNEIQPYGVFLFFLSFFLSYLLGI